MRNLITDVAGLSVGCAHDNRLASGVTVVLFDEPAVASVSVSGGAPAGRDLGCLEPDAMVEFTDAIVLSGGSAYGLDVGCPGLASGARTRSPGQDRARADRAAGDHLRSAQWW
jgi:L-aminopeptidase/D-esterase-like protein